MMVWEDNGAVLYEILKQVQDDDTGGRCMEDGGNIIIKWEIVEILFHRIPIFVLLIPSYYLHNTNMFINKITDAIEELSAEAIQIKYGVTLNQIESILTTTVYASK